MVTFPPFRLDVEEERLWRGEKLLALRRKPFAILRYLVANPRRVVTHDELLAHVWNGAVVSESAVRTHLHELRQVLGDGVIETVIGRGYRFAAQLADEAPASAPTPRRSREIRAMTSLAAIDASARAQLAEVVARFTEGLDTPDVVDARAVLAG